MKLKALSMTSAIPGSAQPTELTSQLGVGDSEFGQFFFRPYFHYYLSGFRCCKDRIQFQLLNRSLRI